MAVDAATRMGAVMGKTTRAEQDGIIASVVVIPRG